MYINPNWDWVIDGVVPSKLRSSHTKFKCVLRANHLKIYEATPKISPKDKRVNSIRVLDARKCDVGATNALKTTFTQETLYQCLKLGETKAIQIQKFEIRDDKIASVSKGVQSQLKLNELAQMENSGELLKELLENIGYLNVKMRLCKFSLEQKNIHYFPEPKKLLVCNWKEGASCADQINLRTEYAVFNDPMTKMESKFLLTPEVYLLGLKLLEGFGISAEDTNKLLNASSREQYQIYIQESFVKLDNSCRNETTKTILKAILSENHLAKDKFEKVRRRRGSQDLQQPIDNPSLSIAWSSQGSFGIYDMVTGETYEPYQRSSKNCNI